MRIYFEGSDDEYYTFFENLKKEKETAFFVME